MSITPDYLVERRKHKHQLRKWKWIVLGLAIVLIWIAFKNSTKIHTQNSDHIAAIAIDSLIFEDNIRDKALIKIRDNEKVKALLVQVNSPGGTTGASERLYNILKDIKDKKPVVVVMGTVAASGGYLISLAADHIIAHNSTLTGSIGVILQSAEITDLATKLGISFSNFKSGELKASPNPTEKITPEVQEAIMSAIQDVYNYFVELVAENRKLPKEQVLRIADGRIYTGRQAHTLQLVDAIGTTEDAIKWLNKVKEIPANLRVVDVSIKRKSLIEELGNLSQKIKALSSQFGSYSLSF